MRIVFFGSTECSVATLEALFHSEHDVVLVVTQPPRRRHRGTTVSETPVGAFARLHDIPVTYNVDDALDAHADLGVLVAFGKLIRSHVLEQLTIVNLHPSLLPRWRGATPVEAALLHGDTETGICAMQLIAEMDAGPIYAQKTLPIDPEIHADALYKKLFALGNEIVLDLLQKNSLPSPRPQIGEATYCGKFTSETLHIDWSDAASHLLALSRIGVPWTTFRGMRVKLFDAHRVPTQMFLQKDSAHKPGTLLQEGVLCADAVLSFAAIQIEGRARVNFLDWRNGARLQPGEYFV